MQLERFDQLKKKFREYHKEISELKEYASSLDSNDVLEVNLVAKRLKIPYPMAFLILDNAESHNLFKKAYQVFTLESHYPLGEFKNTDDIPEKLYNRHIDEDVDKDETYIDLVYHPNF